MEWLIAHEEELNNDPSLAGAGSSSSSTATNGNSKPDNSLPSAQATKTEANATEDGGSSETAASMAVRKKITVEEAQRIITERQVKRAEEERKKEIEDEKKRRIDGQKMAETRAELQDQERIRLAQQIRREKIEKELHKKQVLEQIARDREAMRARNGPKPATSDEKSSASLTPKPVLPRAPASECKIALRFPDGSSLVQKFSPQEQLSAVRLYVQMEKGASDQVEFVAPPNKKLNDTVMNETLENLGLCPASRLEVKFRQSDWGEVD